MDSCKTTPIALGLVLNLGSGYQPLPKPWTNVDYKQAPGVDQIVDLNKAWPWEDSSVTEIYCSHVVEHLDDFVHFMRECQRVLKIGGFLTIGCPYGWSDGAMSDPYHKRPFFVGTFSCFQKTYTVKDTFNPQYDNHEFTFEIRKMELIVSNWIKKFPFWRKWAIWLGQRLHNVIENIVVVYEKT